MWQNDTHTQHNLTIRHIKPCAPVYTSFERPPMWTPSKDRAAMTSYASCIRTSHTLPQATNLGFVHAACAGQMEPSSQNQSMGRGYSVFDPPLKPLFVTCMLVCACACACMVRATTKHARILTWSPPLRHAMRYDKRAPMLHSSVIDT